MTDDGEIPEGVGDGEYRHRDSPGAKAAEPRGQVPPQGADPGTGFRGGGEAPADDGPPVDDDWLLGGRYRLAERLGQGGMGTVWRAHDEVMSRDVAIKEPRVPSHMDVRAREVAFTRMQREAGAAAKIDHPSVISIYDVVVVDGRPWIVMELIRGQSLADVLTEGTLSATEAARKALPVASALAATHAKNVLHRDVKPANIMLGPFGRVVLTDFGIAQVEGEAPLTESGVFVGSPEYIAPERVRGERPGPASDLFSLGVLLYSAVEGVSPFYRRTAQGTLQAVVDVEPPVPALAGELAPLIMQLLSKDPSRRPTAEQTMEALKEASDEAKEPTSPFRFSRPQQQPRPGPTAWHFASAATFVAGAVLSTLMGPIQGSDDDGARGPKREKGNGSREGQHSPAPDRENLTEWEQKDAALLDASVRVPDGFRRIAHAKEKTVQYVLKPRQGPKKNGPGKREGPDPKFVLTRDNNLRETSADAGTYWLNYYKSESGRKNVQATFDREWANGREVEALNMTYLRGREKELWRKRELYYVDTEGDAWQLTVDWPINNVHARQGSGLFHSLVRTLEVDDD